MAAKEADTRLSNTPTARLSKQAAVPYVLKEQIGRGSFGKVYRAEHTEDGSSVAVKIIEMEVLGDEIDEIQGEINVTASVDEQCVPMFDCYHFVCPRY